MLSEINQLQKDKYSSFHLYKFPRVVKSMGTQNRMLVARDWREWGMGNCCFMSPELQTHKMKNSGEVLHNNMITMNTTETYA